MLQLFTQSYTTKPIAKKYQRIFFLKRKTLECFFFLSRKFWRYLEILEFFRKFGLKDKLCHF